MKSIPRDTSIREFLKAVASAEEAHGAVSAAAVAGGLGTSLLLMVAALPKTRSDSVEDRTKLIEAATALSDVQEQLMEAIWVAAEMRAGGAYAHAALALETAAQVRESTA